MKKQYTMPIHSIRMSNRFEQGDMDWLEGILSGQMDNMLSIGRTARIVTRIKELEAKVERVRGLHQATVDSVHHKWKHQDRSHRCGWRVLYEASVSRSKAAIKGDES